MSIASIDRSLVGQALGLLRARDGRLTRELMREPGGFRLGQVPATKTPDSTTNLVCGFCSTGCGLTVHLRDGQAVNLSPATQHPVNRGLACPKGWEALTVLDAPDRATVPLLRDANGRRNPIGWNEAMSTMVARFKTIQAQYGSESVAFLSTGQIASEEMAFLGALAKCGMGMMHGDGNTRQCMASAVVAYKQSFGFDAPPYAYRDLEESDCIVLIGANPCVAHPVLWERVTRNKRSPYLIVIDPRRTETAMSVSLHLPVRPKSDMTLLYGLAHLLIKAGAIDHRFIEAHTNGFEEFAEFVAQFDPERVADETGLRIADVTETASRIQRSDRVSFWWTMGVNQSHQGVKTAQAAINLALMTGNIGRPGTGANSITGQCNAMGSRLFSNTTNLLGGHDFANAAHREKVASVLNIPEERIPRRDSLAYDQIIEGIREGKIRALWVIGTNPAHSWIGQGKFRETLDMLDFLVVQDMYHSTETAQVADLLLPAAGWGEKEGTFIKSERRIGLIKKVRIAPGQALSDFSIFKLVAHYYGVADLLKEWESPEAAFQLLKRLSAGQPCDITGIADY
jgi:anaerobic selenocysteine-containing dehydrogenase